MQALGRELWVAGDELLTVSARINDGPSLGNVGISIRNAADMMLGDDWESVQGELETAAVSCSDFLPGECFQGLVDLFGYVEPVPQVEWQAAGASLYFLGNQLEANSGPILRSLQGAYREETNDSLIFVTERLRKAARLFEPGGFYMPSDPRDSENRVGKGSPRMPEEPFSFRWAPQDPGGRSAEEVNARRQQFREQTLRQEAVAAAEMAGGRALVLIADVDSELAAAQAAASPEAARRSALRRLVRRLHPDQNPDQTAEVMPAFRFVQRLRTDEK